jgi:hypothetical protein
MELNRTSQSAIKKEFRRRVTWSVSSLKNRQNFSDLLAHAITDLAAGLDADTVLATLVGSTEAVALLDLAATIDAFDGWNDDHDPV